MKLTGNDEQEYVLFFQVSPNYGRWQAFLVLVGPDESTCLLRIEDQPAPQAGLHVHANCRADSSPTGAASINMINRIPSHNAYCRRSATAWTPDAFVAACCSMLRVSWSGNDNRQMDLFGDT